MTVYIFLIALFSIEYLFYTLAGSRSLLVKIGNKPAYNSEQLLSNIFVFFDICLLFFLALFRNPSVGTDYSNYLYQFDRLKNYGFAELHEFTSFYKIEYGFTIIVKLIQQITDENLVVVGLMFGVMYLCIYHFIKHESPDILFSIFLFLSFSFFNQSLNITRQYLSASIIMYALSLIDKKELKKYIVLVGLASLIHKTGLLGLLFYPIVNCKYSIKKISGIVIILSIVSCVFSDYVFVALTRLVGHSAYALRDSGELGIGLIINLLLFVLYLVFFEQMERMNNKSRLWLFMAAMTLGFNLLAVRLDIVGRVMIFFKLGYIVSIPMFVNSFKDQKVKALVSFLVIVSFVIYYVYAVTHGSAFGTIPYVFDSIYT